MNGMITVSVLPGLAKMWGKGSITVADVVGGWRSIRDDSCYTRGIDCIADFRGAQLRFRYRDALKLAQLALSERLLFGRYAVVAPDNVNHAIARLVVAVLSTHDVFGSARVCRTFTEAYLWLGQGDLFALGD